MLINRAGAMVLPFLSLYFTQARGFSVSQTGVILSVFGFGAVLGALSGGFLTDKLGYFKVQLFSLIFTAIGFLILSLLNDYHVILIFIFLTALIAETLRPANATAIGKYAEPKNLTKAYSLSRMAANLGFAIGPALGGIIASISFQLIFIIDAGTCLLAAIALYVFFKKHQKSEHHLAQSQTKSVNENKSQSPFGDKVYIAYLFAFFLNATVFFQFFTTLPLYLKQVYFLKENKIGLLLAVNGLFVFLFEMVIVNETSKYFNLLKVMILGIFLTGFSFLSLNFSEAYFILFVFIILISIAEIISMPFTSTIASSRADKNNRGRYMGLLTLSYSAAHISAPFIGTRIIETLGFQCLWSFVFFLALFAVGIVIITNQFNPPNQSPQN